MLKTIQNKLIHSLGGYTRTDCLLSSTNLYRKAYNDGFNNGIKQVAEELNNIARQHYGCSRQEWIDKIYSKIQEVLDGNVK